MARFSFYEVCKELNDIQEEENERLYEVERFLNDAIYDESYEEPDMKFLAERVAFFKSLSDRIYNNQLSALEPENEAAAAETNGSASGTDEEIRQEPDTGRNSFLC